MFRWLAALLVVALLAFGVMYVVAGRSAPPRLTIDKPDRIVGQSGSVDVTAEAPNGRLTALTIALEQNGRTFPLFTADQVRLKADATYAPGQPTTLTKVDRDHVRISHPLTRQSVPDLKSGSARIVVTATRPSFLNLRQVTSSASKDFQVRLEPPRIAVLSTKHYVNHGGSELVVYCRRIPPPPTRRTGRVPHRGR